MSDIKINSIDLFTSTLCFKDKNTVFLMIIGGEYLFKVKNKDTGA